MSNDLITRGRWRVADVGVELTFAQPTSSFWPTFRDSAPPDCFLDVTTSAIAGDAAQPYTWREGATLHVAAPGRFTLEINARTGRGRLHYAPRDGGARPPGQLMAALRALYAVLLPARGGLVLHSSAVALPAGGALQFIGRSGAGKSTIARLFAPQQVLDDELVAVTCVSDEPTVHGTPFSLTRAGAASPLRQRLIAALLLRQSSATGHVRLRPSDVPQAVLPCVALPTGDATLEQQAFLNVLAWAERTPFHRLDFSLAAEPVRRYLLQTDFSR